MQPIPCCLISPKAQRLPSRTPSRSRQASRPSGGDALVAFPRYQSLRMERTARVQAQAARFGRIYHLSGPAAFARNFLLGRRRPEFLLHSFDWLYGHADR